MLNVYYFKLFWVSVFCISIKVMKKKILMHMIKGKKMFITENNCPINYKILFNYGIKEYNVYHIHNLFKPVNYKSLFLQVAFLKILYVI